MNILASYNWIKEYVSLKESAADFARRVSLSGPGVERLFPQAPRFDKMVIGQIVELKPHPNADKLTLALTDLGKEKAEVVCGGTNLSVGMKVAVALPGASVRWHGEGEPIVLEPAEIRGVKSAGMICGASEIGLEDGFPHAEKEILDMSWCKARPGTALAKALDLEDTVFDIEVTTNRPDAFCMVGLAREAAAILEAPFIWKESVALTMPKGRKAVPFEVDNQDKELCTRYQAVVMDGIEVGPSPWWLKNRLLEAGLRPINNIVDITNYVMLELGQPMHAFDYEKLAGGKIKIRKAKKNEKILLLDGSEKKLATDQLVIADAEKPVAVAGVMGGEDSGVVEGTTTIVFEAATFEPVSVRRTGRALDVRSDSSLRFEKGLPEEQTQAALSRAMELCQKIACGQVASKVYDLRSAPARKVKYQFRPDSAERLIGVKIPAAKMVKILKALGFGISRRSTVKKGKPVYDVEVPYWRARDIEGERDFAEEIARVYGYANLPSEIPAGQLPLAPIDPVLAAEDAVKQSLAASGFTEMVNYSFVSDAVLSKAGFASADCVRIANPLSADFEYMRPSLLPGVLAAIEDNQGLFPENDVFEVSNIYIKNSGADLPDERATVLLASYGPGDDDRLFRRVKGVFESLVGDLGRSVDMSRNESSGNLWHPGRTVDLYLGDTAIGTLGELHPLVLERFGIDGRVCAAEFDLAVLMQAAEQAGGYEPIPQFPPVRRDLAVVVDEAVEYAKAEAAIEAASELLHEVELFDVYRDARLGDSKKSFAFHLSFLNPERTLTAEEIDEEMQKILAALKKEVGAEMRG
jgi:phenylalanyl-tRNA synthetase beta chain